jgi:predicted HicB family RNase H-like nuclease
MAHIYVWLDGKVYKMASNIYECMSQQLEENQFMKLIVRIPDELHKKLKVKAAQEGTTMTDMVVKCLERIVKEGA